MIGIKLDGEAGYLETPDDISIDITLENPLLGDADRLSPGGYSLPFNLPGGDASPTNAAKLNHPDVIENNEAFALQKAQLYFDDIPFKSGTLKGGSATDTTIESYFTFGLNSLSPKLKTAKLRDVVAEEIVIDNSAITKKVYAKYTVGGSRTITVNGKTYTGASWAAVAALINADNLLDSGKYLPFATVIAAGNSPSGYVPEYLEIKLSLYYTYYDTILMMDFYLYQDSTDPLQELSLSVDDATNYLFDTNLLPGSAYHTAFVDFIDDYITGTYTHNKFRFPTMFNANLYDGQLLKNTEVINAVNSSGLIANNPFESRARNSVQPFLLLKWVLDKIATDFNFTWEGSFYTDATTATRLIDNSIALDVPQEFLFNRKFCFWRRSFNLNELVPDLTVIEFLKRLASRYNLGIGINEVTGNVMIAYREPIALSTAYDDITALSSPPEGNEVLSTTGFTLSIKKEDSDALSLDESISVGEPEETIEIGCGRLHQMGTDVFNDGLVTGPRTSRKNNEKFGLRIFHYKGITDNGVFTYPAADLHSATSYEALNNFILLIGLYDRFFKFWLLFRKNKRVVKASVSWPLRLLLKFDWALKRRIGGNNFLVKSLKIKMTNRDVKATEVELLTMK